MATPKPPFKTLFEDVGHRSSPQRIKDIAAQLKAVGQERAIEVDEDGNILDGHTRYKILGDKVKYVVCAGFKSVEEKKAHILMRDGDTKDSTAKQERERRAKQKELARHFHDKGETQQQIAGRLRVDQSTVSRWVMQVHKSEGKGTGGKKALTPEQEEDVVQRLEAGDKQQDIAKDYGVAPSTISLIKGRRSVCRQPGELGPVPKNATGRGAHYRAMMANGSRQAAALEACKVGCKHTANQLADIAERGTGELRQAVDEDLLPIAIAHRLLDASASKQTAAVDDAKLKDAAKRTNSREKVAVKAKSKADDLFELLEQTWVGWYAFQRNTFGTGKWIGGMSAANADRINEKLASVGPLVEGVITAIQNQLRRK